MWFRKRPKPGKDAEPAVAPPRPPAKLGRMEAAAWFTVAVAILVWPRKKPLPPPAPPPPWWRQAMADLWSQPAQVEVRRAQALELGRDAKAPVAPVRRRLRDILWATWLEFNKDRAPTVAGGVAFFGILALFPALAAFVSLYGLFADVHDAIRHLELLSGVMPAESLSFVRDQMVRIAASRPEGLGLAFAISLLVSLWSSNAGMKALFDGFNVIYEEREERGLVRLNLISLAFTLGALVFVVVVLAAVVAVPVALRLFGVAGGRSWLAALRWPLLLLMAMAGLSALYRFGPSHPPLRWRLISWGSASAAILWLLSSMLFSEYVGRFGNYDRTYGSLGAAIGFMTWLWITVIVILMGAELDAEIEQRNTVVRPAAGKNQRG